MWETKNQKNPPMLRGKCCAVELKVAVWSAFLDAFCYWNKALWKKEHYQVKYSYIDEKKNQKDFFFTL